jgi:hypothetical protein
MDKRNEPAVRRSAYPITGLRSTVPMPCRISLRGNQGRLLIAAVGRADRRPGQKMRCRGTSSGSGTDDRAGAAWAELEGGPGEQRRRIGRAPVADHLRLGRPGQRPSQRGQITPATREGMGGGWGCCPATTGRSRWRRGRVGGSWSRSSRAVGGRRSWPSQPRPPSWVALSGGPRPIEATPSCWGSCWSSTVCRRRGFRRCTCWSCGCWCGCVGPWSIRARPGSSGCTRCCATLACPAPTTRC